MTRAISARFLLAAALALSGCSSVLGLEGYTFVGDDTGAGGTGGAGGSGGSAGGSGGGSVCDTPPVVDPSYVRGCALAIACTSGASPPSLGQCVANDELATFGNAGCIQNASDCDGYFGCTGESRYAPEACEQSGLFCDGEVAKRCDQGGKFRLNCGFYQGQCRAQAALPQDKALAYPCELPQPCEGTNTALSCQDGASLQCFDGKAYGRSCSSVGPCLGGACVTSAQSCEAVGSGSCQGGKAVQCVAGKIARTVDCAQAGLQCVQEAGQALCRASGCSSSEAALCQERCEGDVAVVCLGGAHHRVDCAQIGAQCTENFDGKKHAACTLLLCSAERLRGRQDPRHHDLQRELPAGPRRRQADRPRREKLPRRGRRRQRRAPVSVDRPGGRRGRLAGRGADRAG